MIIIITPSYNANKSNKFTDNSDANYFKYQNWSDKNIYWHTDK